MMRNKINSDKRLNSDSTDVRTDVRDASHQAAKQQKSNTVQSVQCSSATSTSSGIGPGSGSKPIATAAAVSFASPLVSPSYSRSRSKSSITYGDSDQTTSPNSNDDSKYYNSSNLSSSLMNAFQMPQNIAQVLPNLNMSSLPDYLSQLPTVSMPSMPNISIPTLPMPSIPSLSMPSMPNLSMPNITMPSMPSIPNLNIPSISDLMSEFPPPSLLVPNSILTPFCLLDFPGRKNIKSWDQICRAVKESRKRYVDVCPSLPFSFNFRYDSNNEKLRFYFLSTMSSPETSLFYCDVPLGKDPNCNETKRSEMFDADIADTYAHMYHSNSINNPGTSSVMDHSFQNRRNHSDHGASGYVYGDKVIDDFDCDIDNHFRYCRIGLLG